VIAFVTVYGNIEDIYTAVYAAARIFTIALSHSIRLLNGHGSRMSHTCSTSKRSTLTIITRGTVVKMDMLGKVRRTEDFEACCRQHKLVHLGQVANVFLW
jgi:hypothetical protein